MKDDDDIKIVYADPFDWGLIDFDENACSQLEYFTLDEIIDRLDIDCNKINNENR